MYKALTLAAGYVLAYCVHTPQGREWAKKALAETMRNVGAAEKGIAQALLPSKSKKEE